MNLPTQLTLLRILLAPVFVFLLFVDSTISRIASFIVFTLASITDYYDGYTARKLGDVSMWGKFLDPLADKILVSSALICFYMLGYFKAWIVFIIVGRDLIITALRSYAILQGKPVVTNFFAKTKTFGQFIVLYFIFLYHLLSIDNSNESVVQWIQSIQDMNLIFILMITITFLTVLSGMIYLIQNRVHIQQIGRSILKPFLSTLK